MGRRREPIVLLEEFSTDKEVPGKLRGFRTILAAFAEELLKPRAVH
jgi:hypothetical protein